MATILLVDDHLDTTRAMTRLLTRQGHRVSTARTWAEAKHHCAGGDVDLMLLDLGLPDATPDCILAWLRACGVRTIVCTGHGYPTDVQRSLEAGALAHLTKPFGGGRLLEVVHDALGSPPPPPTETA